MNKIILLLSLVAVGCHSTITPYVDDAGNHSYFIECRDVVDCAKKISKVCPNGYSYPIYSGTAQSFRETNTVYSVRCK